MKIRMHVLSNFQKKMLLYQGWKNVISNNSYLSYMINSRTISTSHSRKIVFNYKNIAQSSFSNMIDCSVVHKKFNTYQSRLISTSLKLHHDDSLKDVAETVRVIFISKDDTKTEVMGKVGERAMYLAHRKGIDMEGACEASLACTTCHCYIESSDEHWDLLPEATEKEEDLLDMAPFLDVNSRLGCQIILAPELDGIVLRLPRATKNFYVDGHKPTPH